MSPDQSTPKLTQWLPLIDPQTAFVAGILALVTPILGLVIVVLILKATRPVLKIRHVYELIPFRTIFGNDDQYISCDNGRILAVLELEGVNLGGLSTDRLLELNQKRKNFYDNFRDLPESFTFSMLAKRQKLHRIDSDYPARLPEILTDILTKWNSQFSSIYSNRFYIIVSVKGRTTKGRQILEKGIEQIFRELEAFNPKILKNNYRENKSELLSFWQSYINCESHTFTPIFQTKKDINRSLPFKAIHFNEQENGIVTFQDGTAKKYMTCMGINRWPDGGTSEKFAEDLLTMPYEMNVLHQLRVKSQIQMKQNIQNRKMNLGAFMDSHQAADLELADNLHKDTAFAEYQITIFLIEDDLDKLDQAVAAVRQMAIARHQTDFVIEGSFIELLWLSVINGQLQISRPALVHSGNLADLVTFFRSDPGFSKSDWGPWPITTYRTDLDELFNFTFHADESASSPGNALLIGAVGSGKTVTATHLVNSAIGRHPGLRAFVFDSFEGCYINTIAQNGKYWSLDSSDEEEGNGELDTATLNPLQLNIQTGTNRDFLHRWISSLADVENMSRQEQVKADEEIAMAIRLLHSAKRKDRSLIYIYNEAFGHRNSVVGPKIKKWIDPNARGRFFNGRVDSLNLDLGSMVAFDMTTIKNDNELSAALLPYLVHCIRESVRKEANPYLIWFEETAHMLRIPMLAMMLKEELQQSRKRRGISILAFQEPGSIASAGEEIKDIILTNTFTQIIFPNADAKEDAYRLLELNDWEWDFVKGVHIKSSRLKRPFLIRKKHPEKGWVSCIVEGDLSILGSNLSIYQSGAQFVRAAKKNPQAISRRLGQKICCPVRHDRASAGN